MKNITDTCYQESIKLLKKNSTKFGLLASGQSTKAKRRSYLSIFGRDASMSAIGVSISKKRDLISSARRSLETLAKYQADNGQIPFYVKPEEKEVDFYYLGCIDATLWWLIAIKLFDKNTSYNLEKKLKININKAINWLKCQEHPNFYLLQQNEASDWADLMPRSGFVLYSNALWYWTKKLYNLSNTQNTKDYFNYIFANKKIPQKITKQNPRLTKFLEYKNNKNKFYPSFVNYSFSGQEVDVFGNILACLSGLADNKTSKEITNYFVKQKANKSYPIKSVLKPIKKKDILWRKYMKHYNLNKPYQYHNGGIWPFIGGWWVVLLSNIDKPLARKELEKLAELNQKNHWQFNEWFHAKNNKAMGVDHQSWNAAMYIMAYNAIK
jgi:glycogen debranching enzyme